eukprot:Hpha_TRINITY_DN16569_c2_g2::TRINITY_DN16569_c2_g2_i1::g.134484::m.134484/K00140/mmsA, iolA, ALDH6A1; malonate-semialdehyde dehydrogenase (acetylating) / methylmalonate-semialdehyde dehydrogenase
MSGPVTCDNYVGGAFQAPSTGRYVDVTSPADGSVIARVADSGAADVDAAVQAAKKAMAEWGHSFTMKKRALCLLKFHQLLVDHEDELAQMIVREHGKSISEAKAEVQKGNETVEYACSLPQIAQGRILEVSRGVTCQDSKEPLGVVAHIVPFNFPLMVPMWTLPIAIGTGNTVVMKPSEKVPMTMTLRVTQLIKEAGIPDGVVNIVNGTVDAVNGLCDHPEIAALTFVGSTRIADLVEQRCHASSNRKRVIALGGAKNHMVAMPDANVEMTAADVVASFTGTAGQRCMAATVLVTVGQADVLVKAVSEKAAAVKPGQGPGEIGPVIDQAAKDRIVGYINRAEAGGAKILVDGRSWCQRSPGFWVGPTVIAHSERTDRALHEEIFGPVLSIIVAESREDAVGIENRSEYGNAACIYTSSGAHAEWFAKRFTANMLGVNIGVPVPREPFSFGGMGLSKFGQSGDITGDSAIEFFTRRKKITTKWVPPVQRTWMD